MDLNALVQNASVTLVALAWKLAGAVALWLAGRWLISLATRLVGQALDKQQFDITLARYAQTTLRIVLNVALIVALLGFFGVETTSFAALLAAGGVAVGVAWGGLLANFAAGVFLVFLRPFKVGDDVTADEARTSGDQDSRHARLRLPTASRQRTCGWSRSRSTRCLLRSITPYICSSSVSPSRCGLRPSDSSAVWVKL